MKFHSLVLKNFRNYVDFSLDIPSGVVVFYGQNGQGKTNLMEAFHFLIKGESFRALSADSLLAHRGDSVAETALLQARLSQRDLIHDVKVTFSKGKKTFFLNSHRVTAASLARQFPVVLFSPESLAAIKEGPDQRRQLLDEVVVTHSTASVKILKDFRHALKVRNRLLRDYRQGLTPQTEARAVLESLDSSYLPLATELTMARLQALRAIENDFREAAQYVLNQKSVDISVEYVISGKNAYNWTRSDILSAMHNRVLELRESELSSGASLVGPQRHDIRVLFAGKDSRFFCSQGQQRALILSFKMAQILYHHRAYQVYPFLLLDDVLSELDPIRRANLVKFLKDIPAQIFLTTTDLSFAMDFGDRRISVFRIDDGMVEQVEPS